MKPHLHHSRKTQGGFTLVEILVSFTVLGLIMVGVAQMMNSALNATIGSYKHMDADTQARMVLDRMAFDISKITKRSDIDYFFKKNNTTSSAPFYGNDQMAFYSESGGYYPSGATAAQDGEVSLVGYMINNNQLVRLSKGLAWNGVNTTAMPAMVFNPLANATGFSLTSNTLTNTAWNGATNGIATGTDTNYQVIGDQVFRLEYTFLLQTSAVGGPSPSKAYYFDVPWEAPDTSPSALKDVTAVVVSIAVLDNTSRATVTPAQLQTAAASLPDSNFTTATVVATTTALPLVKWKAVSTSALGLPAAAAAQVRYYQRFCYLNHLQ